MRETETEKQFLSSYLALTLLQPERFLDDLQVVLVLVSVQFNRLHEGCVAPLLVVGHQLHQNPGSLLGLFKMGKFRVPSFPYALAKLFYSIAFLKRFTSTRERKSKPKWMWLITLEKKKDYSVYNILSATLWGNPKRNPRICKERETLFLQTDERNQN